MCNLYLLINLLIDKIFLNLTIIIIEFADKIIDERDVLNSKNLQNFFAIFCYKEA